MIELYGHPFAAFVWKPLIALYERDVPFAFRMVDPDHPANRARMAELSPTGQMPGMVDGTASLTQSDAIIEHLDLHRGDAPPMVPADAREALPVRMMASIFDDYIAQPMQRIVAEAMRPDGAGDPHGLADAETMLDRSYAWLERRLGEGWAAHARFTLADCAAAPALFYADWVRPIGDRHPRLVAYRARLLARPSVARVVDEARPFCAFFPLGAPDRD